MMYRTVGFKRLYLNGIALFVFASFLLASTACGKDSTTIPPPASPPPTPVASRIEVRPDSVNLTAIGQTVQIQATVLDQNSTAISGALVSWSSDNTAVASVNATGLVLAVGNGAAQVTVRSGDLNVRLAVTVSQTMTRIAINPGSSRLRSIGDTQQLVVTGLDGGGSVVGGVDPAVNWRSSDEAVAKVTAEGLVTAIGNGTAQVTARSASLTTVATVTVEQQVFRIVVSPSEFKFTALDETFQFEAEALDSNGYDVEGAQLTWQSSDGTVATVKAEGIVTARGNGTAEISAHRDDISAFATVSVMIPSPDRAALVVFYEATGGRHWTQNTNWLSDRPIDEWYGVTVDDDERVTRLVLSDNNLTGPMPSDLGSLTELYQLTLNDNRLTGPIPGELGLLPELCYIGLSQNGLSGEIPWELGRSPSLVSLQLNFNQLTGEIPAELGELGSLYDLLLNHNHLTGQIPPELARLTTLRLLYLDYNMLSGPIPPALGNLVDLFSLRLNSNRLSGEIPPELGKMTGLRSIFLSYNRLSGTLPEELGTLPELYLMDLAVNPDLAGPLPRSFLDLGLEYLRLAGTRLCVPSDEAFRAWFESIEERRAIYCRP